MRNTIGNSVTLTLFGESHGDAIGAVLDGLPAGIPVDVEAIAVRMKKRLGNPELSTARREEDRVRFLSGVRDGKTVGTPIAVMIENRDVKEDRDVAVARPGHADYPVYCRTGGQGDLRGGGHASGRLTAPIVALGSIVLDLLEARGIRISSHIERCAGIDDRPFGSPGDADKLYGADFPVLDERAGGEMKKAILQAKADGDSVGGIVETVVSGFPVGCGEPFFDSVESLLSHAIFSIPAVKGVSFGDGFALADRRASEVNDAYRVENGNVKKTSNHMGGILGGLSDGSPIVFHTAVKPTPSIAKDQDSVDLSDLTPVTLSLHGRNDPAIVSRICPVIDALTALTLADLLSVRFGTEELRGV